jgi:nucleoid-associated protein YgaU
MADPTSRHDGAPTYPVDLDGDAVAVELYQPRVAPATPAVLVHQVQSSDRLDLLAARYFGSPFEYWRIADANPSLVPEDILDPGAQLAIPKRT